MSAKFTLCDFFPRWIHSIFIYNEMYYTTSNHSPQLKLAKDLLLFYYPLSVRLTLSKQGREPLSSAYYLPRQPWGSPNGLHGIALTLTTPYGNGWCTRACSVVMLSGVDVPGYDNYLDMLTEAYFCAGSECELWQLSSFFIIMLKAVTALRIHTLV